ncbi:MAG: hypothetical protein OXC19_04220 [Bryobacterales bacterium]|nr:hypothetical protein [Bryobacterales bacterium]
MLRLLRRSAMLGVLRMGYGAYRYYFVLPWGEDGQPIVLAIATEPGTVTGLVESKRASIRRLREQCAASWGRWPASFEGNPERHAQQREWIERGEANERASEDLKLAELESTMCRRAGVAGGRSEAVRD